LRPRITPSGSRRPATGSSGRGTWSSTGRTPRRGTRKVWPTPPHPRSSGGSRRSGASAGSRTGHPRTRGRSPSSAPDRAPPSRSSPAPASSWAAGAWRPRASGRWTRSSMAPGGSVWRTACPPDGTTSARPTPATRTQRPAASRERSTSPGWPTATIRR
jgi:hypothetical protein